MGVARQASRWISTALAFLLAATASAWTPLQLQLSPDPAMSASLFDPASDVYGLRLAFVGRSADVGGLDLCLSRATVDDDFGGIQIALIGDVRGSSAGLQLGVFKARTDQTLTGLQASLGWSDARFLHGLQVGGLNHVALGTGLQLGVINVAEERFTGLAAGFVNDYQHTDVALQAALLNRLQKPSSGLTAGLINWTGDYRGLQAGLANVCGDVRGAQLGLVNQAEAARGLQLGLFNTTRQLYGVQIGLINFITGDHPSAWPLLNARF